MSPAISFAPSRIERIQRRQIDGDRGSRIGVAIDEVEAVVEELAEGDEPPIVAPAAEHAGVGDEGRVLTVELKPFELRTSAAVGCGGRRRRIGDRRLLESTISSTRIWSPPLLTTSIRRLGPARSCGRSGRCQASPWTSPHSPAPSLPSSPRMVLVMPSVATRLTSAPSSPVRAVTDLEGQPVTRTGLTGANEVLRKVAPPPNQTTLLPDGPQPG